MENTVEKLKVFILYDSGNSMIIERPIHEMKKIVKDKRVVLIESAETKGYEEFLKKYEKKILELRSERKHI